MLSLTTDKHCLAEQCSDLQQENQQLKTLVMDLADTLQQQQQQARVLLEVQRLQLLKSRATGGHQQEDTINGYQHDDMVAAGPVVVVGPAAPEAAEAAAVGDPDCEEEVTAKLPLPEALQQRRQQQQQRTQRKEQQQRVAEWLQERGWQEWQGRLPLEPVSSSSSSSLILALEECMLNP